MKYQNTSVPLTTPERFARAVATIPKDRMEAFENAMTFMLTGAALADQYRIQHTPAPEPPPDRAGA